MAALFAFAAPAAAQFTAQWRTQPGGGPTVLSSVAYDDKHHVYLHVWEFGGTTLGRFVGTDGTVLGAPLAIGTHRATFAGAPRVAYSRGTTDDAFLVVYFSDFNGANIFGQIVRYTGQAPSGGALIGNFISVSPLSGNGNCIDKPNDVAYNPVTSRFLVAYEETKKNNACPFAGIGTDVMVRQFGADGSIQSDAINIVNGAGGQGQATIGVDWESNKFLVALDGDDPFVAGGLGAFVRILDGSTAQPVSNLMSLAPGFNIEPTITYLPERDGFLVGWTSFNPDRNVTARFVPSTATTSVGGASPFFALATPGQDGAAAMDYDYVSRDVMLVAMSDPRFIRAALLDANGTVLTSPFVVGTAPVRTGSFYPTIRPAENGYFATSYVVDYTTAELEAYQLPAAATPGPHFTGGSGFTPPSPPPPVRSDITIYRPANGFWWSLNGSTNFTSFTSFGLGGQPGDIPLRGDFDGDGKPDMVIYRPIEGNWYILFSSSNFSYSNFAVYQWGIPGDIPVAADFDGDHKTDLVVYRPSNGTWYVRYSSSNYGYAGWTSYQWGQPGDVPLRADLDGDGKADLVVYRPLDGTWYVRFSSSNYSYANWTAYQWGQPGDIPTPGDFDGDGKTDLVVYRQSDGTWYFRFSSSNYSYATWTFRRFGTSVDLPIVGDFDGDGKLDLTVYRPSEGYWYVLLSSTGYASYVAYGWGITGDMPLPGGF